jgi:cellulose synthase (UDP-forming)
VGEGPTSWADYFNQQKRWAYGIWEILLTHKRTVRGNLSGRQRLLYGCVQFYYPSVATGLLLGNLATAMYLLFGIGSIELHSLTWLALWSASLGSWFVLWFWLRRFNLADHERVEIGMPGMALALFAGPVYLAAACAALLRRPLAYAVTAKGKLRTVESPSTFRLHLGWAAVAGTLLAASFLHHNDYLALRVWSLLTLATGLAPPIIAMIGAISEKRAARSVAGAEVIRGSAAVRSVATAVPPTWRVYYRDAGERHEWRGGEPVMWGDPIDGAVSRMMARAEAGPAPQQTRRISARGVAPAGPAIQHPSRRPATGVARVPVQRLPVDERPSASIPTRSSGQ